MVTNKYRTLDIFDNKKLSVIGMILILLFPCSIAVDLINGYTQVQLGVTTPIGVLFRISIMVLVIYDIREYIMKKKMCFFRIYLYFFICIFPIWLIEADCSGTILFDLSVEIDHAVKYIYNILIVSFFLVNRKKISKYNLPSIIGNYGLIIAFAIIFSFFTGLGNSSFGEDYGFGTKSYFKAGNDLGITLLYAGIVSSMSLVDEFDYTKLLKTMIIFVGCCLVGSRVSLIGALFWCLVVLLYLFFLHKSKSTKEKIKIIIYRLLVTPMIFFAVYSFVYFIISSFDSFMLMKFSMEGIENARSGLTDSAILYINSFDFISLITGNGISPLFHSVSMQVGGEDEFRVVEADFHELLGGYGILGIVLLSLPYLYFGMKSVIKYFKNPNFISFGIVFIGTSFLAIAFLGGHCFKNTMVAPIYGYVACLIYHNYESFINK